MIVHQFVPTLEPGAVGAHTLMVRDVLRAAGHTSEVFASEIEPVWADRGAHLLRDARTRADVIVYQMAIGSIVGDAVLARDEPIVVNHHNLTPMRYITGWQPVAAHGVAWGRAQLRELATRSRLGVADSSYNEQDLMEAGFTRTTVVPILLDLTSFDVTPAPGPAPRGVTWLFVGRLAPNKAQHDIVKAFAAYRQFHNADAHLNLVGGGREDGYARTLQRFIHALGLDDAVTITGSVSDAQLAAHYAAADVFVVCSEHEGFCVPLLESMYHRVPIVAYAATAVPETLGEAGLLLDVKDPCTVAAAVDRVVGDTALRHQLVEAGARRVQDFDLSRTGPAFVEAVTSAAGN
ncbi:MAG: Group 1 glycosyl transferase [Actinomycetia bacterium]|jgi:glycosyltransferase involved in cell wall biosynthesis|nr:Group 1 glycosyl transferase [Actinomycetes bacterium]